MAGDLIPPPSPAGRPEAEGLRRGGGEEAPLWAAVEASHTPEAPPPDEPQAPDPAPLARFRNRFGFIMGALAGTGVAALVVTILIIASGGPTASDDLRDGWSAWQPRSEDAFSRAAEIAAHVGPRYRLDDGSQIVDVEAGPIAFRGDLPAQVVIRTAQVGGRIVPIEGEGVLYTFNGLGENGSISIGERSAARFALLQQAAVEVALYTFRYTDADHVVVMLPPPPPAKTTEPAGAAAAGGTGTRPADVVFFRPGDLEPSLALPLDATIPQAVPLPKDISKAEADAINARVKPHAFVANFQQPADGRVYLVLERGTPVAAQATPTATPSKTP